MNWIQKIAQTQYKEYPLAGGVVSGLQVLEGVDNTESISASILDYEILDGIREIPMVDLENPTLEHNFYAKNDYERCRQLAAEIQQSGEIMPLIAAMDSKGVYILEGGHRMVALHLLGIPSFPALLVIDRDEELE